MSAIPLWLKQIKWSKVSSVAELANNRGLLPSEPGCYVFTKSASSLRPNHVMYIGKATNLRNRVGGYLVDFMNTAPTKHKGRAFIFDQRDRNGDHNVFVRWVQFGANPAQLETNLCEFFLPHYTSQWEDHELWDDNEKIDPTWLGWSNKV